MPCIFTNNVPSYDVEYTNGKKHHTLLKKSPL